MTVSAEAKTRLAISTFENKTGSSSGSCKFRYRRWASLGKGLKTQLTTWLVKTRRFSVQERENLKKMHREEHQLINSDKRYAPKANQFKAAHYSITGAITKFEMCESGLGGDVDVGGLFGLKNAGLEVGAQRSTAKVGLDIRIVDVETGEVLSAFTASGKASSTGVKIDGDIKGADFGTEAFKNTPLGEATDKAVKKAAKKIFEIVPERTSAPSQDVASARGTNGDAVTAGANGSSGGAVFRVDGQSIDHICLSSSFPIGCKPIATSKTGKKVKVIDLSKGKKQVYDSKNVKKLEPAGDKLKVGSEAYVSCYFKGAGCGHRKKTFKSCLITDQFDDSFIINCGGSDYTVQPQALFLGTDMKRKVAGQK